MQHHDKAPCRRVGAVGWFSLFLGIVVAAFLLVLWLFLADYQSNLPQNLANQILTAYQSSDARTIHAYSTNLPEALENPTQFAQYYAENTDLTSLYFYTGNAEKPQELCYEFVAENKPVATLTLRQMGIKSRFGFVQYEIATLVGHALTSYHITAPSNTLLLADGRVLDERYRTNQEGKVENFSAVTDAIFQTETYEITDFVYFEKLDALSLDNSVCTITWSADHRTATVEKQMSVEQKAEITAFAERFSEAYSVFATKQNGARGGVLQLLYPSTPFYNALLLYNNDWGEAYTSDRYDNRVIDHFVQYSPTEFSCNIRFDYVIRFANGFEKAYPYNMTYYLTSRSGRLLLVDMQALPPA